MKNSIIICSPAYGRDYITEEQVLKAWNEDKDFRMENRNHAYINKQDVEHYGVPEGEIKIRYNRKENIVFIKNLPINNEM